MASKVRARVACVLFASLLLASCTKSSTAPDGTLGTSQNPGTTTSTVDLPAPAPTVPDVVGMSFSEARSAARAIGLKTVIADRQFSSEPKLTVLAQQAPAGTDLVGVDQLSVTVAITPHVPRLVGLALATARSRLDAQDLKVQVIKKQSTEPKGAVLTQSPHAGKAVDPGTRVKLVVVSPHVCGSPLNPWCFSVLGGSSVIYRPPQDICSYLNCIESFWSYTNGYVMQCADGWFSHSGGVSGSCSSHGGNARALYAP